MTMIPADTPDLLVPTCRRPDLRRAVITGQDHDAATAELLAAAAALAAMRDRGRAPLARHYRYRC